MLASTAAAAVLAGVGVVSSGDEATAKPGQDKPAVTEVGRNWKAERQDAQPNDKARTPADRGRRMTPAERLATVRPNGKDGAPAQAPAGELHAPATEEAAK